MVRNPETKIAQLIRPGHQFTAAQDEFADLTRALTIDLDFEKQGIAGRFARAIRGSRGVPAG
jgi:hypothetical protein